MRPSANEATVRLITGRFFSCPRLKTPRARSISQTRRRRGVPASSRGRFRGRPILKPATIGEKLELIEVELIELLVINKGDPP
jgi:hypothetical protein